MKPRTDHYAVLGVSPDADAPAIRAAYLELIKATHPDRSAAAHEAPTSASAINEAYSVLKDPDRRRSYDRAMRSAPIAIVVPARRRGRAPRSRLSLLVGLPLLAVLACVALLLARKAYEPRPLPPTSAQGADEPAAAPESQPGGWVDSAMVEEAVDHVVRLHAAGRADAIARYSRICFAQFELDPTVLRIDHCAAFDIAASALRIPGFAQGDLRGRHERALARLKGDSVAGEIRLREIRMAAISVLARRMGGEGAGKRD